MLCAGLSRGGSYMVAAEARMREAGGEPATLFLDEAGLGFHLVVALASLAGAVAARRSG